MEKQSTLANYTQKVVQPSLSLFAILKESYKTSFRNGRILFFIIFIMFSCYSILELGDRFILSPIGEDLVAHAMLIPKNGSLVNADSVVYKDILKDVRNFLFYEFVALSFWSLVFVFAVIASVHSTSEAYTAKVLSLKDVLSGTIRGKWRRAFKTSCWIILISLATGFLWYLALGMIVFLAQGSAATALIWTMFISGGCYAVYLCSLSMFSLVVSVLEDDKSGLKAIIEGSELMKGKKLKGFVLMVVMILAGVANSKVFSYLATVTRTENETLAVVIGLAISLPRNLVYSVLNSFVFVVYTLFYHECKVKKTAEENRALYAPVPAVAEF